MSVEISKDGSEKKPRGDHDDLKNKDEEGTDFHDSEPPSVVECLLVVAAVIDLFKQCSSDH